MNIINHLTLADKCARKWCLIDNNIEYDDYYQQACLGLVVAAKNYNPKSKAKFSSYAFIVMNGAVCNMRSVYYTGCKEGFERRYPIPIWVLLDHPPGNEDDDFQDVKDNWYEKNIGSTMSNFALREEIKNSGIVIDTVEKKEYKQQCQIAKFSIEVKAILKDHKISIATLAQHIGVSQPTVSRWLNNDVKLTKEKQNIISKSVNFLTQKAA